MIFLFIFSLTLLIIFLSWKVWEIHSGKKIIPQETLDNIDEWIRIKLIDLIIHGFKVYKIVLFFIKKWYGKISEKFFVLWYKFMEKIGFGFLKLRDIFKKRNLNLKKKKDSQSDFLKDIADFKNSLTKDN